MATAQVTPNDDVVTAERRTFKRQERVLLRRQVSSEVRQGLRHTRITLNIRQQVRDGMALVPGIEERDFMAEAEICLRHNAGRATIIMVWCIGYYHLCQFIIKNHLATFNAAFQKHYPGLWKDAK